MSLLKSPGESPLCVSHHSDPDVLHFLLLYCWSCCAKLPLTGVECRFITALFVLPCQQALTLASGCDGKSFLKRMRYLGIKYVSVTILQTCFCFFCFLMNVISDFPPVSTVHQKKQSADFFQLYVTHHSHHTQKISFIFNFHSSIHNSVVKKS